MKRGLARLLKGNDMWIKKGNIFDEHHAQLPVADVIGDIIRIYYSTRVEGKSLPLYIEVDANDPSKILRKSDKFLLELGSPGSFDSSGVMPTCIVNHEGIKYMYYIGWTQRLDVPYHNTLGLAISEDGVHWKKAFDGPVLGTSIKEPGYVGTAEIIVENGVWRMWYLSCREWATFDKMEPLYDIKYAESLDGINWDPKNKTVIPLKGGEGGISAARVIKNIEGYEMFFSVRKIKDYRTNKEFSYRIMRAYSVDGKKWNREEEIVIDLSESDWDSLMTCYPAIIEHNEKIYMFYNGNGFGKTGIGYAIKNKK